MRFRLRSTMRDRFLCKNIVFSLFGSLFLALWNHGQTTTESKQRKDHTPLVEERLETISGDSRHGNRRHSYADNGRSLHLHLLPSRPLRTNMRGVLASLCPHGRCLFPQERPLLIPDPIRNQPLSRTRKSAPVSRAQSPRVRTLPSSPSPPSCSLPPQKKREQKRRRRN